jgi:hypothetical protein
VREAPPGLPALDQPEAAVLPSGAFVNFMIAFLPSRGGAPGLVDTKPNIFLTLSPSPSLSHRGRGVSKGSGAATLTQPSPIEGEGK